MKKINTRSILFALLLMTSLSSYVFLASHSDDVEDIYTLGIQAEELVEQEESDFALPEVMLVKHIIDIGKRLSTIAR